MGLGVAPQKQRGVGVAADRIETAQQQIADNSATGALRRCDQRRCGAPAQRVGRRMLAAQVVPARTQPIDLEALGRRERVGVQRAETGCCRVERTGREIRFHEQEHARERIRRSGRRQRLLVDELAAAQSRRRLDETRGFELGSRLSRGEHLRRLRGERLRGGIVALRELQSRTDQRRCGDARRRIARREQRLRLLRRGDRIARRTERRVDLRDAQQRVALPARVLGNGEGIERRVAFAQRRGNVATPQREVGEQPVSASSDARHAGPRHLVVAFEALQRVARECFGVVEAIEVGEQQRVVLQRARALEAFAERIEARNDALEAGERLSRTREAAEREAARCVEPRREVRIGAGRIRRREPEDGFVLARALHILRASHARRRRAGRIARSDPCLLGALECRYRIGAALVEQQQLRFDVKRPGAREVVRRFRGGARDGIAVHRELRFGTAHNVRCGYTGESMLPRALRRTIAIQCNRDLAHRIARQDSRDGDGEFRSDFQPRDAVARRNLQFQARNATACRDGYVLPRF